MEFGEVQVRGRRGRTLGEHTPVGRKHRAHAGSGQKLTRALEEPIRKPREP